MIAPQTIHPSLSTGRDLARAGRRGDLGRYVTRIEALDRALDGGLPIGRLVELVGRLSSGRFSTVLALLARATGTGEAAALIDLGDQLAPASAAAGGVDLDRLLWVRPRRLREALSATEMALTTGFTVVALDLGVPPVAGGRGAEASWVRLARAADRHVAALLVSTPYRATGTAAAAVLRARRTVVDWRGNGNEPRLLSGLRFEISGTNRRGGRREGSGRGDWVEDDAMPTAAAG